MKRAAVYAMVSKIIRQRLGPTSPTKPLCKPLRKSNKPDLSK